MFSSCALLNGISVQSTSGRGFTPEEVAERALDKIIYVGENVDPVIRDQALAYRDRLRSVLVYYMHEAVKSNKTTLVNRFKQAGQEALVPLILQE